MGQRIHPQHVGWGRTAWYGAEAGIALTLLYAVAFIGYALVRSTLNLLATPDLDGGLAGTLFATWISMAVPAFVLAATFACLAALLGALTALVLRVLLSDLNTLHRPRLAIATGIGVCLTISLVLLALLSQGLGVTWTSATAEALTFWLILPLVTLVLAGGLASWQVNRMLAA
jgi:hypothetical protein